MRAALVIVGVLSALLGGGCFIALDGSFPPPLAVAVAGIVMAAYAVGLKKGAEVATWAKVLMFVVLAVIILSPFVILWMLSGVDFR